MKEKRNCILCSKPTEGSVGAAGISWPMICQPCKDREDQIAAAQLKGFALVTQAILGGSK
jgi:hypothetical protein